MISDFKFSYERKFKFFIASGTTNPYSSFSTVSDLNNYIDGLTDNLQKSANYYFY